jgi:hypothetical protein
LAPEEFASDTVRVVGVPVKETGPTPFVTPRRYVCRLAAVPVRTRLVALLAPETVTPPPLDAAKVPWGTVNVSVRVSLALELP